ncbi:hypothetical protein QP948_01815 [Corynebacterium bovis]|nr:hypothetical protein [Corynebacterium bovis]MDK8510154.1 hypothetical protein [Corynebacterium bovis]
MMQLSVIRRVWDAVNRHGSIRRNVGCGPGTPGEGRPREAYSHAT